MDCQLALLKDKRGIALLLLSIFILISLSIYIIHIFGIFYAKTNIFYDKRGNSVINGFNLTVGWELSDLVINKKSELRAPVKTKLIENVDIERGYFTTYIHTIGYKNITFDNIKTTLDRTCNNCTCIGTHYILVHSNIIYLNEDDLLMIEPKIESYSKTTQNAMLKRSNSPLQDTLNLLNYRSVPVTIVVHFINERGNLDIKHLSLKQAACIYLTLEQNKRYV